MSSFLDPDVPKQLLAEARAGNMSAHEALFRRFHTPVYNLALRMLAQRAAAEEVVQDTFVEVIRRIGDYRGEAPLGGWVRRIAVNFSLMQLRSVWHKRAVPLAVVDEVSAGANPDRAGDISDLEGALRHLSAKARTVVWLHDVEGLTHKEIGLLMGKTASFSKSQLARAHERLRVLLAGTTETEQCMQVQNSY